ncbi:MAG: TraK family protein [Bilophila wadsworthia]|uniref:TraK family protein n=1 Tax=Bilophila wadsworthia TaxID=35833 RepID=UPI002910F6F2|nr:TraK family protein [Bilophila wadsworthia]MDU4375129.1 TraK family protein [Bilophila wadsworthia]
MPTSSVSKKTGWLLEALTQDPDPPQKGRKNRNLVSFLANLDEIKGAFEAGWNAKAIWKALNGAGAYPGSYDSFLKYKNKYDSEKMKKETGTTVEQHSAKPLPSSAPSASGTPPNQFKFEAAYDPQKIWGDENSN